MYKIDRGGGSKNRSLGQTLFCKVGTKLLRGVCGDGDRYGGFYLFPSTPPPSWHFEGEGRWFMKNIYPYDYYYFSMKIIFLTIFLSHVFRIPVLGRGITFPMISYNHSTWANPCTGIQPLYPDPAHVFWSNPCIPIQPMYPEPTHVSWSNPCILIQPMYPDPTHVSWSNPCTLIQPMYPEPSLVPWSNPCILIQPLYPDPAHVFWSNPCILIQPMYPHPTQLYPDPTHASWSNPCILIQPIVEFEEF